MPSNRGMRLRLLAQNGVFVLLAAALAAVAILLAREHRVEHDLSFSGRNTLSPASLETLARIEGPIEITAFATPQDPRLGDLRRLIRDFVARYQRAKPDIRLEFVDPREQPKAAAAAGVQANGELVIEYNRRSERLLTLSEIEFTNLLIRLARTENRLVMYLEGHGERSLAGGANHDLGNFGRQLVTKGISAASLDLSLAPEVPDNARLLVIASPQVELRREEVDRLLRWLGRGGNLLWLIDQEPLRGLEPLAEALGLVLSPGVVIDPEALERGGPPAVAIAAANAYASHPITRSFRLSTVFPFARAIGAAPGGNWSATPLIEVAARGWIETGPLEGRIVFDRSRDLPGPVNVAMALERQREERIQRVVVVGTGHFLANTYLGNGGNLDLGINMVNWLAGDDALIAIQPRSAPDVTLTLSKPWLFAIVMVFLVIAPLALLAAGAWIAWRRRRA